MFTEHIKNNNTKQVEYVQIYCNTHAIFGKENV